MIFREQQKNLLNLTIFISIIQNRNLQNCETLLFLFFSIHILCFFSKIMLFSKTSTLIIWVLNLLKNITLSAKFISIELTFDRWVFESKSIYFVLCNAMKYRKIFTFLNFFVSIFNAKYSILLLNNTTSFWNFKLSTNTNNFSQNVVFTIILFENDVKKSFCNMFN